MDPPLHPWFNHEQSTSCCSERETRALEATKFIPSIDPVVENDQHDPQCPWFLTGVTAPLVLQSIAALASTLKAASVDSTLVTFFGVISLLYPFIYLISSSVLSVRKLTPCSEVCPGMAFHLSCSATLTANWLSLKSYSALVAYDLPCSVIKLMNLYSVALRSSWAEAAPIMAANFILDSKKIIPH